MTRLAPLIREMRAAAPRRFAAAALLTALVPLAGMALMGLSGWFIAASAIAGLAGLGQVFDFLRPSAVIRLLTLGRSASRYGERLTGHDATLRALEALRLRLYATMRRAGPGELARLHSAQALNRLTADVEAAEGLLIRLVFPAIATAVALVAGGAGLWLTAGGVVALAVVAVHAATVAVLLRLAGQGPRNQARRHEAALQDIRARTAETLSLRADLLMQGRLPTHLARIRDAVTRAEAARAALDRCERLAGLALSAGAALAVAAVLIAGRRLEAPWLLLSVLVALSMSEAPRLLWRGLAERGRIELAARRLAPKIPAVPDARPAPAPHPGTYAGPVLRLDGVTVARPGGRTALFAPLDLTVGRGAVLGIEAPSGAGKSTLLAAIAGLAPPLVGRIGLLGQPLAAWPEAALRDRVTLVPQCPALIGGTIRENLALVAPDATAARMRAALDHVALWPALAPRGGLDLPLGERGAGLSGGEQRRLALARAILRRPDLLLLDEPTAGLDAATAEAVLAGIRAALPQAAIVIVSHRTGDMAGPGQIVRPTLPQV